MESAGVRDPANSCTSHYQITNYQLIRTHIGTDVINSPYTFHRRVNSKFIVHVPDNDFLRAQRFCHTNIFFAANQRANVLRY